jgi:hypothetical protein
MHKVERGLPSCGIDLNNHFFIDGTSPNVVYGGGGKAGFYQMLADTQKQLQPLQESLSCSI